MRDVTGPVGRWLDDQRGALAAERILDAAALVFAEHGVNVTGMADVARAAGCSRATLYRYFENRGALHAAFVGREARRIAADVARRVGHVEDPADRLVETVMAAITAVRGDATLVAWFAEADAGIAVEQARASQVIADLAAAFLGEVADPETDQRAAWLVRVIVSLLTMPGRDEHEERSMLERFVAPVLAASASATVD